MLRKAQKTNDLGFLRIHRNPSLLFLSPPNYYLSEIWEKNFFLEGETKQSLRTYCSKHNLVFLCWGLELFSPGLGH